MTTVNETSASFEDFNDEDFEISETKLSSVQMISWHSVRSPILITYVLSTVIICIVFKGFIIKYVFWDAPPKRPFNLLILFDQAIIFPCHFALALCLLINFITGAPASDIGGILSCQILWLLAVSHQIFMSTNGFWFAIYRIIIMKFPMVAREKIGDGKFMLLIFSGLMSQSSLLIYLWIKGVQTRKVAVVINLCTSRNNVMSNIVADYEGRTAEMMQEETAGLQCLVGVGNATEVPASAEDIANGKYPSMDASFKRYLCGSRGSQLASVDSLVKNITDMVENSWNKITSTINQLAGGNMRRKRQIDETNPAHEDYACVKIVLMGTAYRSCIPKYGNIRINCTSAIGSNVLCYCHTDDCNAGGIRTLDNILICLAILFPLLLMKLI